MPGTSDSRAQGGVEVAVRRGLPRVVGGEPWPPVDAVTMPTSDQPSLPATPAAAATELVEVPVRRGLPRVAGGQPWPPVTSTHVLLPVAVTLPATDAAPVEPAAPAAPAPAITVASNRAPAPEVPADKPEMPAPKPKVPTPAPANVGSADPTGVRAVRASRAWVGPVLGALALIIGVVAARWIVATPAGAEFVARYDGLQPLPETAPVGFPAWLGWTHFFNMFLMVMIVRTGWSVRREAKAPAYWAPRSNPKAKISLTLWLHLVLDAAWIVLGAVFYILLFSTGQWMRIVPTSWEAIPNAVSAGLQLLTLNWPTEHPWVHYNALQELSYFAVVFVASPLAIISGLRMSPWWPKRWTWLPMTAARAVHFPTMVFFVIFTIVHVALVLLTGLRVNLNAMFAGVDDAQAWTGVFVLLGALAAIAAAWFATRPLIIAQVAGKFGTVSQR